MQHKLKQTEQLNQQKKALKCSLFISIYCQWTLLVLSWLSLVVGAIGFVSSSLCFALLFSGSGGFSDLVSEVGQPGPRDH